MLSQGDRCAHEEGTPSPQTETVEAKGPRSCCPGRRAMDSVFCGGRILRPCRRVHAALFRRTGTSQVVCLRKPIAGGLSHLRGQLCVRREDMRPRNKPYEGVTAFEKRQYSKRGSRHHHLPEVCFMGILL